MNLILLSLNQICLKRNLIVVIALAVFSLLSGYLLSAISFVGRAGIDLFYTQYRFLKTWWKGALLVFIVWIILFIIQSVINKRAGKATSNMVNAIMLVVATIGLYFSYADFRHSLAHRWLGERFHLGVYLFWAGWMAISILMLLRKQSASEITIIKRL